MKKLWDTLWDVLPIVWGILMVFGITLGLVAGCIWLVQCFFALVGVN